jgi:putative ABC transport system permease protein
MKTWIIIKVALKALVKNKMRTFLTMLGIIIGVGAVVGMMAITEGSKKQVLSILKGFGNDVIVVTSNIRARGRVSGGMGATSTLTPQDIMAIQQDCPNVLCVTPLLSSEVRLIYRDRNWKTFVRAGNEHLAYVEAREMESGHFFTAADVTSGAKVCVVGQTIVDNLFDNGVDPVGKTIRINRIPFRIIGVMKGKGGTPGGHDYDDMIKMPYTTMMQRFHRNTRINSIMASAVSSEAIPAATEEITEVLRQRHRKRPDDPDNFQIFSQNDFIEMSMSVLRIFSILYASVASVALVVGGIGIMNIMLVSVNERVREIGIRMALGAKRRDILSQFLIESITLSAVGGILGIFMGYVFGKIGQALMQGADIVISPMSVIIALVFAAATGIFFGLYPAWKASNLDPIEALRHE